MKRLVVRRNVWPHNSTIKTENTMDIDKQKMMLETLSPQDLRERYAVLYGHTPTTKNRVHLINKILWAMQRDAFGDISEAARKKALSIADDRDVRGRFPNVQRPEAKDQPVSPKVVAFTPEPNLLPGSVLTRDYQGKKIRVVVLKDGFEWNGQAYKSLSAIARAITGTRWNGKLFFGLKKKGGR